MGHNDTASALGGASPIDAWVVDNEFDCSTDLELGYGGRSVGGHYGV